MIFKRGDDGEPLLSTGPEFYNDSVPFEGAYVNYAKQIVDVSMTILLILYDYRTYFCS